MRIAAAHSRASRGRGAEARSRWFQRQQAGSKSAAARQAAQRGLCLRRPIVNPIILRSREVLAALSPEASWRPWCRAAAQCHASSLINVQLRYSSVIFVKN